MCAVASLIHPKQFKFKFCDGLLITFWALCFLPLSFPLWYEKTFVEGNATDLCDRIENEKGFNLFYWFALILKFFENPLHSQSARGLHINVLMVGSLSVNSVSRTVDGPHKKLKLSEFDTRSRSLNYQLYLGTVIYKHLI